MKNTSNMSHSLLKLYFDECTVLLINYVLKMRGGQKSLEDIHKNTISYYKQSIVLCEVFMHTQIECESPTGHF